MGRGLDGYFFHVVPKWHCVVFRGPRVGGLSPFAVALARGKHLFPFRTEQLSPSAPMVLGLHGPGRVGRRRFNVRQRAARRAARGRCATIRADVPEHSRLRPRRSRCGLDRRADLDRLAAQPRTRRRGCRASLLRRARPLARRPGAIAAPGTRRVDRRQADGGTRRPATGPALAVRRTQGLPVGVLRHSAGGPVRAREILEQNEGAGEAGDTPHGVTPRGRGRAGEITSWEHVFVVSTGLRTERLYGCKRPRMWLHRAKAAANELAEVSRRATTRRPAWSSRGRSRRS